jgi:UDP-N-acetyl-2-amino-2-deoxyglucuronate dehydrogenase
MGNKLRFGIIGCGKIAPRHTAEINRVGMLAGVCDIIPERADPLAEQYQTKAFYTITDFLAAQSYDVVAVCTPNGLHAQHSILCLQAQAHVLCEKPLATATTDAKTMMDAAAASGKKLFVVKSTRYNPALIALKEVLDKGKLGKIFSFQLNCFWNRPNAYYSSSWKGDAVMDGGILFTQFSHYIDALLWLLNDSIKQVSGYRNNYAHEGFIDFEDTGIASLQMTKGPIGGINWSVNSYQKNMEVSLVILAENGSIKIGGEYMNTIEYQLTAGTTVSLTSATGEPNDYGFYKGSMSNHDKVYDNLLIALNNDKHPFSHAIDGLKTVEAIQQIYNAIPLA